MPDIKKDEISPEPIEESSSPTTKMDGHKELLSLEEYLEKLEAYKDFVLKTISKMNQQMGYIEEEISLSNKEDEQSYNELVHDKNLLKKDIGAKESDLKQINDLIVDAQAIQLKKLMDLETSLQEIEDKLRFY